MPSVQTVKKAPSTRKDPAKARVDRSLQMGGIKNNDPSKKYVWAYKASQYGGVGYYENLGYDIEVVRDGGPYCVSVRKNIANGSPIEWMDNVLMSISLADIAEIEAEGQRDADDMDARILSKSSVVDGLRGISGIRGRDHSPVMSLENGTSGPQVELE